MCRPAVEGPRPQVFEKTPIDRQCLVRFVQPQPDRFVQPAGAPRLCVEDTQKPLHFSCLYKTARFLVATKQRSPMFFRGAYVTLQMCTSLCDLTFVCHLLTFAGSIPPSAGLKVFRGRKSYVRNTAAGDETPTVSISAEVRATVYVIGTPLPLPHGAATQMGTGRYSCRSSRLPPLAKRDKLKFYLISPALSPGGHALQ